MKFLIVETNGDSLRSKIMAQTIEDSELFVPEKPIGYTESPHIRMYDTILEAVANGWALLAPPSKINQEDKLPSERCAYISYVWWLTKNA